MHCWPATSVLRVNISDNSQGVDPLKITLTLRAFPILALSSCITVF